MVGWKALPSELHMYGLFMAYLEKSLWFKCVQVWKTGLIHTFCILRNTNLKY